MPAIPTQSIRVTSSPAHIPVLIHKGLLAGVIRDKADSVRLYRDRPSALLLPDPFDFPMAERTVTFLSVRVVHRHFSFSSVFYVKRHPLQVAGALDFRITKKARPVPKRAQSCLILCILPAATNGCRTLLFPMQGISGHFFCNDGIVSPFTAYCQVFFRFSEYWPKDILKYEVILCERNGLAWLPAWRLLP